MTSSIHGQAGKGWSVWDMTLAVMALTVDLSNVVIVEHDGNLVTIWFKSIIVLA